MSHFNFHAKIDPNSVVLVSLAPEFKLTFKIRLFEVIFQQNVKEEVFPSLSSKVFESENIQY